MPEPTESDLTEVRRLLREVRAEGPPPPDVAARLDETLAGLVAERSAPGITPTPGTGPSEVDASEAPVDELAARRRRRRTLFAGAGLVAAATIVAAGFLGQLLGDGENTDQAGDRSSESMNEAPAAADDDARAEDSAPDAAAPSRAPEDTEAGSDRDAPLGAVPLTSAEERAVRHTLTELGSDPDGYQSPLGDLSAKFQRHRASSCAPASDGAARTVLVVVDGEPRVLALMPQRGDGSREVKVLDCTSTPPDLVDTVEVPAS
ncbi:hypothetical protein [Nocardioides alcanivorans]|uniref:hypothetical protein n=1 Tax=Nocardioides alcanivorans TaxID=2897352 RepID=UPI001F34B4B9|nr:hypothetical protein [Nocardioides alcanivorans]